MNIVILKGDGIGPEIAAEAVKVLAHLNGSHGLNLALEEQPSGLAAYETHGSTFPAQTLEACRRASGVVLAPVDSYVYPPVEKGGINPSAAIRRELDLYANIRPARVFEGVPATAKAMDLVIVRENTEGFYADRSMHLGSGEFMPTPDVALAVRKITRQGCERIARSAFELAMRRRKKVTMVHKANVLKVSDGLFRDTVTAVGRDYPQVTLEERLIDAMTALLIRTPDAFDVVVTTNMYGDILSDEATEIAGGIGLGGAINAGDAHAIAQATHGSAPDIAGQGKANPTALLLSTAMLLGWMGGRHGNDALKGASQALEQAVASVLAQPASRTVDLGGSASTSAFGDAVVAALG